MTFRSLPALAALVVAASTLPAVAGTATTTFPINATFVSACTVSAATLDFGSAINPTTASVPLSASTTLNVTCTSTTPYSVALNAGVNAGGASNFSSRQVKNGTNTLGYQLYMDSLHVLIWGDGTLGSLVSPGVGIGSSQSLTVYGSMPSLTGAVPGTYSDTVTVTVSY